jgi:hypothetical protein
LGNLPMKHVRPEVYKSVQENDLSEIVFVDPFTEVTRKAKRNLIASSFAALLIAVLKLEITGFLGLQTSRLSLENELAQGLACAVVVYFLLVFTFSVYIDYSAWQFQRERQLTKPYLDLISMLENHIEVTATQVNSAVEPLQRISLERETQAKIALDRDVDRALGQLKSINERIKEIAEETRPLLISWKNTISKMNRLAWRLRARFLGLWGLDILFPLTLGSIAILETYQGLSFVLGRISS